MLSFEFATAGRILFGSGKLAEAGKLAAQMGKRALLVSGTSAFNETRLTGILESAGVEWTSFPVRGEPDIFCVEQGMTLARTQKCDLVISLGGGSALDVGKAVAAMLTNPGELMDYLEVVGKNQILHYQPAPHIAIPTTAGTGSEVTKNAVLSVPEKKIKASLRSPLMLPNVALVDPELTYSLPPEVTASTGLDALTQVIEPYLSRRATPMTDLFCREGIIHISRSLLKAYQNPKDAAARQEVAWGSLLGGLCLANAGLGAAHGFAAPLGGMFHAPHGAICARLLPVVFRVNRAALLAREPQHPALPRFEEISRWVTGREKASPEDGAAALEELCQQMKIPPLSAYGMKETDIPAVAEKAASASSMQANPLTLTREEMELILRLALT